MKRINCEDARTLIETSGSGVQIVDIRDEQSYAQGHMDGAVHIGGSNLQAFIDDAELEQPLIVCCYHGHMSLSAAAYFEEQGFAEVYSLDGGYTEWVQGCS